MIRFLTALMIFSAGFAQAEVLNFHSVERIFLNGRMPQWEPGLYSGRCFQNTRSEVPAEGLLALRDISSPPILLLRGPGEGETANMYETGDPYIMAYAEEMLRRQALGSGVASPQDSSLVSVHGRQIISLRESTFAYVARWENLNSDELDVSVCFFRKSTEESDRH